MKRLKTAIAAATITGFISAAGIVGARAECTIAENFDFGGRTGTIQDGDLVKFFPKSQMGLTGEANAKREFNDAEWAGIVSAVEPKGSCVVALYGPWGHNTIRQSTPQLSEQFNDKATGAGCYCQ